MHCGGLRVVLRYIRLKIGTRYMVDLFPWLLIWFMARPAWRPGAGAKALCGMAALFNLYGAVYMLGA